MSSPSKASSSSTSSSSTAHRVFHGLTEHPFLVLVVGLVALAFAAAGLGRLHKETSVDAFIPQDHPSVQARDRATEIFGLRDPIAVALTTGRPAGAWSRENLETLRRLHHAIAELDNVRADRVTSLVSESQIHGDEISLLVDPILDDDLGSAEAVRNARRRAEAMPPLLGTLVAEDGSALMIVAELEDARLAADTYEEIVEISRSYEADGRQVHVAGQGALSGYLSRYIDQDARTMVPLMLAVIWCILFLAFFRLDALLAPFLVIVAAAGGCLGLMGWSGVPYYAITSALPIVVMAIAVADSIHILTAYFELRSSFPESTVRSAVVGAMVEMWRPITLTTLTTLAGFGGLAIASIMPPIRHFGIFAAVGVAIAWLFSMAVLPAVLTLLRLRVPSRLAGGSAQSRVGRWLTELAQAVFRRRALAAGALLVVAGAAALGAWQLRVDRDQVENFRHDEPIHQAHLALNRDFAGTAYLDVMVESEALDGALEPELLRRVIDLQEFLESQPHVSKSLAITDYLTLLHAALEPGSDPTAGRVLPASSAANAQYLLLFEASGDADDLAEEIDPDQRTLLVRAYLDSGVFSQQRQVVEAVTAYLEEMQVASDERFTLTGRVHVDYHWMTRLERSHFRSISISLLLVTLTSAWLFRSPRLGLLAALPVMLAALVVYGVMGWAGIFLEPATSMFAAIAIGVGIDFSIHLIDRLRVEEAASHQEALSRSFPPAARACFFNAFSLAAGFAVLWSSELPTLVRFGSMITVACLFSFLAAMLVVPLFASWVRSDCRLPSLPAMVLIAPALVLLWPSPATAGSDTEAKELEGHQIAEKVHQRPEAPFVERRLEMELIHKNGRVRQRQARVLRLRDGEARRALIRFTEPRSVADMAFLSVDFHEPGKSDDQWIYLPATGKVRRIPAAKRGDRFLGTELSYEDIKAELRFPLDDYAFSAAGSAKLEGRSYLLLDGRAISEKVAKELRFASFRAWVDPQTWMPRRIDFADSEGEALKRIDVLETAQIGDFRTPLSVHVVNHQSGHQTGFRYFDVSFPETLDAGLFTPQRLAP